MSLFNDSDVDDLKKNINEYTNSIIEYKFKNVAPTFGFMDRAFKIVLDFISKKKRIIYGGYAQNQLVIKKSPKDAFYDDEHKLPDIDFYSLDPIHDLYDICDALAASGLTNVQAMEAQHKETYKIFVEFTDVCDISYVPTIVFNNIPTITINNIRYVTAHFAMIDLYKMLTEPLFSSFRWEKTFPRIVLLQKLYPFSTNDANLEEDIYPIPENEKSIFRDATKIIETNVINNESIIVVGANSYNYFLDKVEIPGKSFVVNHFYEIITTNYKEFAVKVKNDLVEKFGKERVTFVESYPLWALLGFSVEFFVDGIKVCYVIDGYNKCIPRHLVNFMDFTKADTKAKVNANAKKESPDTPKISIGSFDYVFLHSLMFEFKYKILANTKERYFYTRTISRLILLKKMYLKQEGVSSLDIHLFGSFITKCVGFAIDPARETRLMRNKKAALGQLVIFKYSPGKPKKELEYVFLNSSGNPIKNTKNNRLFR